jgi:integrase
VARKLPPGISLRTNGDGSKSYVVRWRDGGTRDGKPQSHSYPRLAEAADAKARIDANGRRCPCPKHSPAASPAPGRGVGLTFGAFAERHAAALTGVGPGYRATFVRELHRHFAPFLDRPLGVTPDAISDLDVREWIVGMETGSHPWLRRPLSPTTVRRLLAQVGSVMASAQDEGLVNRNPFRGHRLARRDRDKHSEMVVLSHAEWAILEAALPEGVYRDLCAVLIGTGLRWGEATALAVGHVDPMTTPPRLHVARAWQDDGANGYQLGTPKSVRSRRTVSFADAVLDALVPHVAGKGSEEFVFTTPGGAPLRHANFYHRVWRPALEKAARNGLERRPRIHDLRHSHVSWLIAEGRPVPEISRRLGHESVTTTIDRYGHILPQLEADTIAALNRAMPRRVTD